MNCRERVLATINHKEPDRVPIDLWGSDSRLINDFYFKVIKYLGLKPYNEKVRPGRTAEYVDYRISDYISSDFRHAVMGMPKNFKSYKDKNGNIIDEWGVGKKQVGVYPQVTYNPLANAEISDIDKHKWPVIEDPGRIEGLEKQVKEWYENTDYCITAAGPVSGLVLEFYWYLRGVSNFFKDLYLNVKFANKLINKIADLLTELYIYFIKPIGKYITWIEYESDLGMQGGTFMSRDMFKKFLKKPMTRIYNEVRKIAPNTKIFLHSCGAVREIIPDFIDMEVEILSSIQPLAKGMDPFELKKEFSKDLVFHGGGDLQKALCGTVEETIYEAQQKIKAFAPGGGYIFGPSNHLQIDVPVENFFAFYKTGLEFGKYPINIK